MSLLLYNSISSNGIKLWCSVRERAKLKLFNSMRIDKKNAKRIKHHFPIKQYRAKERERGTGKLFTQHNKRKKIDEINSHVHWNIMANKSPLSIPSIGSSSSRTPSPLPKDVTQAIAAAAAIDESSESENETEPARIFQRRVSTSKNLSLNGSVSKFSHHLLLYCNMILYLLKR